jgi:hypothetical protein
LRQRNSGSVLGRENEFFYSLKKPRPCMQPAQPLLKEVPRVISTAGKRPGLEAFPSIPSSAEIKK